MSISKIDYGELAAPLSRKPEAPSADGSKGGRRLLRFPLRVVKWALLAVILAVLPFLLLIRGGVFAYQQWELQPWLALALSATATTLLLALYAFVASRRIGAGKGLTKLMTRAAMLLAGAYVVYSVMFVAVGNVKSPEVKAEYTALHPLLRLGASALILVDSDAMITDAGRTPDFYRRLGLPPNESSLHFEQESGFVHALDLRTIGRSDRRNRAVEIAFRAMGFHTLRHVGTADHLHVSLR
ncbi:MAG: hypothetical protein F4123_09475 [Gemmatimonadetes bacterium]|nr:hypothetical protein [Gemmatimonadota bacterium]MYB99051.1 hypothetical protein [Gemmatimonadota bacterium]MYI46586.1 hypothetical protein [Gemmatimonadota bacterium]